MNKEFRQVTWDPQLASDFHALLQLALNEDLDDDGDWTTQALVAPAAQGRAELRARQAGVVAGLPAVAATLRAIDSALLWKPHAADGDEVQPGTCVGTIVGPVRGMLSAERVALNFVGRLSGIATLTRQYVAAVAGTKARIYDTRKTTPGWRQLEKYAVRCGGGCNHRSGLYEAVLIKDNHLACGAEACADPAGRTAECSGEGARASGATAGLPAVPQETRLDKPGTDRRLVVAPSADAAEYSPTDAVRRARQYLEAHATAAQRDRMIIEVEVDTLAQLADALPAAPDIVLLDNMSPDELEQAVALRDRLAPAVELEASGGVNLKTVAAIARSGVERISVGALTHAAASLDFGLDWGE